MVFVQQQKFKKNMKQYKNLEDVEKDLVRRKPIKFKDKKSFKTLNDMLTYALTKQGIFLPATHYHGTKKESLQCRKVYYGRSLTDLYLLSKHYFPKTKMIDIKNQLNKMSVYAQYCSSTQQTVIRISNQKNIFPILTVKVRDKARDVNNPYSSNADKYSEQW